MISCRGTGQTTRPDRTPTLLVAEGRLNTKGQTVVSRSKTGRGKVTAPIFLLVPQLKLPKRKHPA